jgi:hypothetical protein
MDLLSRASLNVKRVFAFEVGVEPRPTGEFLVIVGAVGKQAIGNDDDLWRISLDVAPEFLSILLDCPDRVWPEQELVVEDIASFL